MEPNSDSPRILSNNTHQNWLRDRGLRKLNLGISFLFASAAGIGYNGSLMNGLLVLPEFEMMIGGLSPNIIGLMIAGTSLGSFMSFIPASYLADIIGRKWCVGIGCCLVIIASIFQVITHSHWVFFVTRILAGAGAGIAQTAAPLLVTEIAHPRQRNAATGLYNGAWYWGSIGSATVTFAALSVHNSWSWRIACLLQMAYPIAQLIGLFVIPESPRWLVAKGRKEEALEILIRYHANGLVDDELVLDEFQQICKSISIESSELGKWSTFLSSRRDIHRLSICILVGLLQEWSGNGIIFYYLAPILTSLGIKHASDQATVNVSMQIWSLIVSAGGAFATGRYGRRVLWLLSTVAMLVFLLIIIACAGIFAEENIAAAGLAVVPMLFLFSGAFNLGYVPLFIAYPAEILPFQLRAKGIAIVFSADAAAAFFNQFVNPLAFTAMAWRYYIVYVGCLTLFFVFVYYLFPETKGGSLEETARKFDNKEALETDTTITKRILEKQ